jgi:hypothetical protein
MMMNPKKYLTYTGGPICHMPRASHIQKVQRILRERDWMVRSSGTSFFHGVAKHVSD